MKVDILAFGAHPDDVELGSAGSLSRAVFQGKSVIIIDLTKGELGTRGNANLRKKEALDAANIIGAKKRENLKFKDGFFSNDEQHQLQIIQKIREYQPEILLCNSKEDRHIDHGKANRLVNDASFLSGLEKIKTIDTKGLIQKVWRPKVILEYIQWNDVKPDIIIDISGFLDKKIEAVEAYSSQFFDSSSEESNTPISTENFKESISYRAKNFGRLIGTEAGEGFTSSQPLSISDLNVLIRS